MSILTIQDAGAATEGLTFEASNLENLKTLYLECAERASHGLSGLIGAEVPVELTALGIVGLESIHTLLQEDQRYQTGVHSRITGDLRGDIYLFFSKSSAHRLVQMGFKRKGFGSLFLSRLEESFLNEFVNILVNSFWQVFNEKIPVRWWLTPPKTLNRPENALSLANRIFGRDSAAITADLALGTPNVNAVLCFLPSEDSLEEFMGHLR